MEAFLSNFACTGVEYALDNWMILKSWPILKIALTFKKRDRGKTLHRQGIYCKMHSTISKYSHGISAKL